MKKRGVFFSLDALIAIIIIFLVLLVAYPLFVGTKQKSDLHNDILTTLSSLKVGEAAASNIVINNLIVSGTIINTEKSLLLQLAEFNAVDSTNTAPFITSILSDLDTNRNIGIWLDDANVYEKGDVPYADATNVQIARQTISGIAGVENEGELIAGYSARAFLNNAFRNKYFYFGGYVGDGVISANIDYNGVITSANIELAINKEFELFINGFSAGIFQGSVDDFTPVTYELDESQLALFNSGTNTLEFKKTSGLQGLYIAGGFIKIIYNSEAEELITRHYFPGVEGLINIYDGFYVPNTIQSMNIRLRMDSNFDTFLNIGGTTVFEGTTNGEEVITLSNSDLSSLLNYNDISQKTIPLRLGLKDISYLTNLPVRAETFSVTDLSGSMSGPAIDSAKAANDIFIDTVLEIPVNTVGLVGYATTAPDNDFHTLSEDPTSLHNKVADWGVGGWTCICCGVNKVIQAFLEEAISASASDFGPQIAYYHFNENNRNDYSGYENHATGWSGTSFVSVTDETELEFALYFNEGDFLDVPDLISSNEGTISLWIRPDEYDERTIFDASTSTRNFYMEINGNSDLRFFLENINGNTFYTSYDVGDFNDHSWHHVAGVWRYGSQGPILQLYVDGILRQTNSANAGTDIPGFTNLRFGRETPNSNIDDFEFRGRMDEIRIFNTALSSSEIAGLADLSSFCSNNLIEVSEACEGQTDLECFVDDLPGTLDCASDCSAFTSCVANPLSEGECGDGVINSLEEGGREECDNGGWCSETFEITGETCSLNSVCSFIDDGFGNNLNACNYNGDGCSFLCLKEESFKSMVVMSDGEANSECTEQNTGNAKTDAIQAACEAWENYGIKVYTVAFGSADTATLTAMAECGDGAFYSAALDDLLALYQEIAQDIIQASYVEQTVETIGNIYTKLFPDSYIEFVYDQVSRPFGMLLTVEEQFDDDTTGGFFLPAESEIFETKLTSYSGSRWTDEVKTDLSGILLYRLEDYGIEFIDLGDPYHINIPNSNIIPLPSFENRFILTTALNPDESDVGSAFNKIIYSFIKNVVGFSDILALAEGCIWEIEFNNGNSISVQIPVDYEGTNVCTYNTEIVDGETFPNINFNPLDAIQQAVGELLASLDFDGDGTVDIQFTEQDLQIDFSDIAGIPFIISTEVQVRIWD
jgi:hypothetical protein